MRRRLVLGLVAALLGVSALQPTARAQEPAERPPFADWLAGVRQEALSLGIRTDIVEQALGNIPEPLPIVLERDRSQAEIVLPLETYVSRRLTRKVITSGRQMYGQHKELLDAIEAEFGVPGRIIVAIWGVESNYGRFSGVRPTVAALATLAWDPRRATFFRGELFNALEILNRGDIELANMKGSWAGAMGQPQFMPSSYLQYATDRDGDGRRDIWSSSPDVFASIANYLKGHGWTADQRWGREVSISESVADKITTTVARREGTCRATRDMTVSMPVDDWATLGVRALDGGPLPKSDIQASLVSGSTRQFLVYGNYDALLSYNCAHAYALSVAMLGDMVAGSGPIAGATSRPSSSPAARTRPARPARRGARKPAAGKHVSGSMRPARQSATTRRPRATSASRRTAVSRRATRLRPARRSGAALSGRNRAATAVRPSAPALAAPPTPADSTPAPSPAPVRDAWRQVLSSASRTEVNPMPPLTTDDRGLLTACPSCGQVNRLAFARLDAKIRLRQVQAAARRAGRAARGVIIRRLRSAGSTRRPPHRRRLLGTVVRPVPHGRLPSWRKSPPAPPAAGSSSRSTPTY